MIGRLSLALLLYSAPAAVLAQEISAADFAANVAQTDMFELEAARLEVEKGANPQAKAFAQMMIEHHTASSQALSEAAQQDGVTLPEKMNEALGEKLEALRPLNGPALDAAYISTQVSVHTDANELFAAYNKSEDGKALKSFALQTHPTIRMHLMRARSFNVE